MNGKAKNCFTKWDRETAVGQNTNTIVQKLSVVDRYIFKVSAHKTSRWKWLKNNTGEKNNVLPVFGSDLTLVVWWNPYHKARFYLFIYFFMFLK